MGTALILRLTVAPLVGLAAVVWAHFAHYGHDARLVLYLITAMTVLTLLTEPLQAAFQAIERMKYLAYADIVNKSAQTIIGIAVVLVGFRVVGIAANMAIMAGRRVRLDVLVAAAVLPHRRQDEFQADGPHDQAEHAVLGFRGVRDDLLLDRHDHALADDALGGRRVVRGHYQPLPNAHVPARARADGLAAASRCRVRQEQARS